MAIAILVILTVVAVGVGVYLMWSGVPPFIQSGLSSGRNPASPFLGRMPLKQAIPDWVLIAIVGAIIAELGSVLAAALYANSRGPIEWKSRVVTVWSEMPMFLGLLGSVVIAALLEAKKIGAFATLAFIPTVVGIALYLVARLIIWLPLIQSHVSEESD